MIKRKTISGLLVLALTILAVLTASCITIVEKSPPGSKSPPPESPTDGAPVIKHFTASPDTIAAGQQVQLGWEVSGAARVEIGPLVGTVDAVGSTMVSPATTTTYTLTAANAAGSNKATVVVTVAQAAVNRPDLIVTGIQIVAREIYYKTKNAGNGEARGCRAHLFVDGLKQADDYIETLAPGEERNSPFKNYAWPYLGTVEPVGGSKIPIDPEPHVLKVCADVENTIVENDETNNCTTLVWGEKYVYPFVDFAHQALWTTGYGVLKLPLPAESVTGAALVAYQTLEDNQGHGKVLVTVPQQVVDGWIQGKFGEFYTDELRQTRVRDITIPAAARFTAEVGFTASSPSGCRARFMFGTMEQSGVVTFAPAVEATMDGKLDSYVVDLDSLAKQKRQFILRVEIIGAAENVRPVWVNPKVFQP